MSTRQTRGLPRAAPSSLTTARDWRRAAERRFIDAQDVAVTMESAQDVVASRFGESRMPGVLAGPASSASGVEIAHQM